jgi:apoptosis-stimulating of p53 protein 1
MISFYLFTLPLLFSACAIDRSSSTHIYTSQKNVRGNIAAVEPYNHTPQKSTTNEQQQHQQIIQDLAIFKLKSKHQQQQQQQQQHSPVEGGHYTNRDEGIEESKLAGRFLNSSNHPPPLPVINNVNNNHQPSSDSNESENQKMPSEFIANGNLNIGTSSLLSHKIVSSVMSATGEGKGPRAPPPAANECDSDTSEKLNGMQIASSTPLNAINKSIAEPFTSNTDASAAEEKPAIKPKALHQISLGNHVVAVPPRKPISSVAPTSIKPKVGLVAPINNSNTQSQSDTARPALPPKPSKNSSNTLVTSNNNNNNNNDDNINNNNNHAASNDPDNVIGYNEINLPIKAKPLTIKKQPLSEQPKLRSANVNVKNVQYTTSRRIEMPPAFLFPEVVTAELRDSTADDPNIGSGINQSSIISKLINGAINLTNNTDSNGNHDSGSSITSNDETDKSATPVQDEKIPVTVESVVKRKRNLTGDDVKAKLARRVSFDPLALLLDASLEGELELVRKTAMQVPNPSAANDEGITALHNAICAGHLEIVK